MDSLIFELQIVFYFQLFLSANVRHNIMHEAGEYLSCFRLELVANSVFDVVPVC